MTTRQPSTARTRSRSASASTSTIPPTQPNQNRIRTAESIQESDNENQGETETEGEEDNAAEGLVLMHGSKSEAVTTEMVEVRVLDARGHPSTRTVHLSALARRRLEKHLEKKPPRDHAKALSEVNQFDRPSSYIALEQSESCKICKTGNWACSIQRNTNNGVPRSIKAIVGIRCAMCTSGSCDWPDSRKKLPLDEKKVMYDRWIASQGETMRRRREWFEVGSEQPEPNGSTSTSSRAGVTVPSAGPSVPSQSASIRPISATTTAPGSKRTTMASNARITIPARSEGSNRSTSVVPTIPASNKQPAISPSSNTGPLPELPEPPSFQSNDTPEFEDDLLAGDLDQGTFSADLDDDESTPRGRGTTRSATPVLTTTSVPTTSVPTVSAATSSAATTLPTPGSTVTSSNTPTTTSAPTITTTSKKRRTSFAVSDSSTETVRLPGDPPFASTSTSRSKSTSEAKKRKTKTPREEGPASADRETFFAHSDRSTSATTRDPDSPRYSYNPKVYPSPLLHLDGSHKTLNAEFSITSPSEIKESGRSILYPAVARRFRSLSRQTRLIAGLVAVLTNLATSDPDTWVYVTVDGEKRIRIPPYIYTSFTRCTECERLQKPNCFFAHIQAPTPNTIVDGSIPLGNCLGCLSHGRKCVMKSGYSSRNLPFVKCLGPMRASLISRAFDCQNSTVSLLTATIPSRPPKDKAVGGQVIEPQQPKNDLVMLQLLKYLREDSRRYHWESIWSLVAVVGKRLDHLFGVTEEVVTSAVDMDSDTDTDVTSGFNNPITGTFLTSSELSNSLSLVNPRNTLESISQSYSTELATIMATTAMSNRLSAATKPRYIYPNPLSPNTALPQDIGGSHHGSAHYLLGGLMVLQSTFQITKFNFGAWVIDPDQPIIYTFGMTAEFKIFQDPITLSGWTHLKDWSFRHIPYHDGQSEQGTGPRAVEFLRLLCTSPDDHTIEEIADTVLRDTDTRIRKRHLNQYLRDCKASQMIVKRIQETDIDDLAVILRMMTQ